MTMRTFGIGLARTFTLAALAAGALALAIPCPRTLAACSGDSDTWCTPTVLACRESCYDDFPNGGQGLFACVQTCNREYKACAIQHCDPTSPGDPPVPPAE